MKLRIKLKMAWYDFKSRCQRFIRGYSYGDVWDMDCWFISTVKPMLIHLRDYGIGIPLEFKNDPNLWNDILTEMIDCLNMMDEDNLYEVLGFGGDWGWQSMTADDYNKMYQLREDNKDRFFKLFSEYFYNLWD